MPVEQYHYLCEMELEAALLESKLDLKQGNYSKDDINAHVAELFDLLSYTLIFTDSYKKRAKRFAKKHPELAGQYRKVLYLLKENPQHPSLRLHLYKRKVARYALGFY